MQYIPPLVLIRIQYIPPLVTVEIQYKILLISGKPECCHHGPPGPTLQPWGSAGPDAGTGSPPDPPASRLPDQGGLGVQERGAQGGGQHSGGEGLKKTWKCLNKPMCYE